MELNWEVVIRNQVFGDGEWFDESVAVFAAQSRANFYATMLSNGYYEAPKYKVFVRRYENEETFPVTSTMGGLS